MRIRKQVYDLRPNDLAEHPVWEFALEEEGEEGQDEATVRPLDVNGPVDSSLGMQVVRAEFTLADGTVLSGYLTPENTNTASIHKFEGDDGTSSIQPVIVTESGQVMFWYGLLKPDAETIRRNYATLGKAENVFPIRYRSVLNLESGPVEGELRGFLYLEHKKSRFFSKTKQIVKIMQ